MNIFLLIKFIQKNTKFTWMCIVVEINRAQLSYYPLAQISNIINTAETMNINI